MLKIPRMVFQKRFKHAKHHWSNRQDIKSNKVKALENLDNFYNPLFKERWKSIRIALLSEHKYVALVNNFGDSDKIKSDLEINGAIDIRSIYNACKETSPEPNVVESNDFQPLENDGEITNFMNQQTEDELSKIYPEDSDVNLFKTGPLDVELSAENPVDYKKPLEQVIRENLKQDDRRIVDEHIGLGGLQEFVPASKIKGMEDWVFESDQYKYYTTETDFPLTIESELNIHFPESLSLYTYENGNVSQYISPRKCTTGVSSHFLMDGSSIFPVLALNLKPGEMVLDACAAPGGKSLLMLQSLLPGVLVSNDLSESRVNRIKRMFREFIFDFDDKWDRKICCITQSDARGLNDYGMYDKILVDVPCTNDRHSVMVDDNNIFKPTRMKERLHLPVQQSDILSNCIQLLKPGGSLVYSTCSLSPIQNDGVVHMALSRVFKDYNITTTIKNLNQALRPFSSIFKFEQPKNLRYGQLIIPNLVANFGPMYFCKITRNQ